MRCAVSFVLAVFLGVACGGSGGSGSGPAAKTRAEEVSSWLYATRGVVLSWVDGKISPEAAVKNLEATEEMLKREGSTPGADARLAPPIAKAQTILASVRQAVQKDDKGAALDLVASLTDVRQQILKAAPKS
jgi:hypothetical protein